jgi:hypothetical protein
MTAHSTPIAGCRNWNRILRAGFPAQLATGQCFIDDEVLAADGVLDLSNYQLAPGSPDLELDFWMDWD